jgi:hypothetical protein
MIKDFFGNFKIEKKHYKRECDYLIAQSCSWAKMFVLILILSMMTFIIIHSLVNANYSMVMSELDHPNNTVNNFYSSTVLSLMTWGLALVVISIRIMYPLSEKSSLMDKNFSTRNKFSLKFILETFFLILLTVTGLILFLFVDLNVFVGAPIALISTISLFASIAYLERIYIKIGLGYRLMYLKFKRRYCKLILKDEK